MKINLSLLFLGSLLFAWCARGQGTAFTYQGRLTDRGLPADGLYDFQFNIFAESADDRPLTGPVDAPAVSVSNGLFTVTLDFGDRPFTGANRWLEIGVRPNRSEEESALLSPRQPLNATPYAVRAANFSGVIEDTQLSANIARLNSPAAFTGPVSFNDATGNFSGNGAGMTNVALTNLNSGGLLSWPGHFVLASSPAISGSSSFLTTADMNGDGKVDLVSTTRDSHWILTNDGTGNFAVSSSPPVPFTFSVTVADVNGDGRNDLISANWNTNTLTVLTNNGDGGFALASLPFGGANPIAVAAADVDSDGYVDLISARFDQLLVLTNNHAGSFALASSVSRLGFYPNVPNSVATADFNGDGKVDLVSVSQANTPLLVFTNDGTGGFAVGPIPTGADFSNTSVTAADVNGDGKMDALTANWTATTVSVLTNDGTGKLIASALLNVGGAPNFVVAADVNSDGKTDVIGGNYFGSTMLTVLTNDGHGGFALVSAPGGGFESPSVAAADVNGDGRIDLIGGKRTGGSLSVFFNAPNFSGSFSGTFTGNNTFDGTNTFTGHTTILPPASLSFGAGTRQMLNLYGNLYGIGVQPGRMYFRSGPGGSDGFTWFRGGAHSESPDDPGPGGQRLMTLTTNGLSVNGTFVSSSDRNQKENFTAVEPRAVLEKVAALPITRWHYKIDPATPHLGPIAQDFHAAFGLGIDDKHIATVDADGVALAAIQGLNELLKEKDAKIAALEKRLEAIENRLLNP